MKVKSVQCYREHRPDNLCSDLNDDTFWYQKAYQLDPQGNPKSKMGKSDVKESEDTSLCSEKDYKYLKSTLSKTLEIIGKTSIPMPSHL